MFLIAPYFFNYNFNFYTLFLSTPPIFLCFFNLRFKMTSLKSLLNADSQKSVDIYQSCQIKQDLIRNKHILFIKKHKLSATDFNIR